MATPPSSTVLKAFQVLRLFAEHPLIGAGDCARLLGTPRASAHRLLVSLEAAGALESNDAGRYRLALRLFELGAAVPVPRRLHEESHVALERLNDRTALPAHLAVLDEASVLYLEKVHRGADTVPTTVGRRGPPHATAVGKALLAFAGDEALQRVLERELVRYTPHTACDAAALGEQLAQVRRQGVAYEREEMAPGLVSVAAPVRNHFSRVVAAVSVAGPASRYGCRLDELAGPVWTAARTISCRLGWQPERAGAAPPASAAR